MAGEIWLYDSNGVMQRKIVLNDATKNIEVQDNAGSKILEIEAHGSRHIYGGADAIPDDGLRFSQIAKVFGSEISITVGAGGTAVIPKGVYLVAQTTATAIEYSPDGGSTWRTVMATGGGLIISDGTNVRLNNKGTSDEVVYLLPVL